MELQTNRLRDPLFARFGLQDPQKGLQQLENEWLDHGTPSEQAAGPLFARFGQPEKSYWYKANLLDPFLQDFGAKKVQKGPNKLLQIKKKSQKSAPKVFFKTVQNSKDTFKGHQANSKISSSTLFWGPQSLFVPTTPTPTPNNNTNTNTNNNNNNQQPTTNNQQPTTNNQQPTTNNQQPTTNKQQTTNNKQPTTNNKEQTTNNQQPTTNNNNKVQTNTGTPSLLFRPPPTTTTHTFQFSAAGPLFGPCRTPAIQKGAPQLENERLDHGTPNEQAAGPLFARFGLQDPQKGLQQLENEWLDHGTPSEQAAGPLFARFGQPETNTKQQHQHQHHHTDTRRTCWTPFCKISAPKGPNKLLQI